MGRVHPCCSEEKKVRKGLWSPEEDERLASHIARFGVSCWSSIPELAGLQRCGKSCRLRWMNYLRPDLKRGRFSQHEEDLIISLHKALGNRLPGRSDNEIKNFWNARLRKKLRQKEASTSSTAVSKEPAARRNQPNANAEVDDRSKPAPSVFTPFVPDHVAAAAGASGASSCDDSSAAGSFFADPAAATCAAVHLADGAADDRNAAAAESGVTPTPSLTTSTSACTDDARGSCDDGFFRAMVDDPSFLFGDFYLDGDAGHHGQIMSFWEGHAFS
ncbi:hypothetical protein BDA96_03G056800 [Sorghum bicolor]|uniref:Uncharacterized protein n=1 Tax=Sorghum bicolor TaxID=4558 RepID=A0A921RB60_SORBI|nr:hypothetical protein BDA96_03G056800 [Sorghum bicolor]